MKRNVAKPTQLISYKQQNQLRHFCQDIIRTKYSDAFNFFLIKPVNQIIEELKTPTEIAYYDFLLYDNRQEIMRRLYSTQESQLRLRNYIDYYSLISVCTPPCYEKLTKRTIMEKRRRRLAKLTQRKEEHNNVGDKHATHSRNKILLANLERKTLYLEDIDLQTQRTGKTLTEGLIDKQDKVDEPIDSKVRNDQFEVHDIYDPVFTSDDEACSIFEGQLANEVWADEKNQPKFNLSIESEIAEIDVANESRIQKQTNEENLFTKNSLLAEKIHQTGPNQSKQTKQRKFSTGSLRVNFSKKVPIFPNAKCEDSNFQFLKNTNKQIQSKGIRKSPQNSTGNLTLLNNFEKQQIPNDSKTKSKINVAAKKIKSLKQKSKDLAKENLFPENQSNFPDKQLLENKKKVSEKLRQEFEVNSKNKMKTVINVFSRNPETPSNNFKFILNKPLADKKLSFSTIKGSKTNLVKGICSRTPGNKVFEMEPKVTPDCRHPKRFDCKPANRNLNIRIFKNPKTHSYQKLLSPIRKETETLTGLDNIATTLTHLQPYKKSSKENFKKNSQKLMSTANMFVKSPTGKNFLFSNSPVVFNQLKTQKDDRMTTAIHKREAKSLKINLDAKLCESNHKFLVENSPFFNKPIDFQSILDRKGPRKIDSHSMTMANGVYQSRADKLPLFDRILPTMIWSTKNSKLNWPNLKSPVHKNKDTIFDVFKEKLRDKKTDKLEQDKLRKGIVGVENNRH